MWMTPTGINSMEIPIRMLLSRIIFQKLPLDYINQAWLRSCLFFPPSKHDRFKWSNIMQEMIDLDNILME